MSNVTYKVVLLLAFRMALDVGYVFYVYPKFSYAGFTMGDMTGNMWLKVALSYLLMVIYMWLMIKESRRIAYLIFFLLSIFIVFPMLSLWALSSRSTTMLIMTMAGMALFYISSRVMPGFSIPLVKGGMAPIFMLASLLTLALFYPLVMHGTFNVNFDLLRVYDYRASVHESIGRVGGYALSWLGKIIVPALTAFFYYKKNYLLVLVFFILQLFLFAVTTHKEFIIYPFVVILVMRLYNNRRDVICSLLEVLLLSLVAIEIAGMIDDAARVYVAAVISRIYHVIALNFYEYYDYFQNHPFVFWSNSMLGWLMPYPFDYPVPVLIGSGRYGEGTDAFANAGFIASAYMHAGFAGIMLYSVLLGILVKITESLTSGRVPYDFGAAVSTIAYLQLVNTDLTTALLTHGIAMSMLVLFLLGHHRIWKQGKNNL